MNNETILDDHWVAKPASSNKWKHFGLFYLVQVIIEVLTYWIGADAKPDTTKMNLISLSAMVMPVFITAVMIRTYKSTIELKFSNKIIPILGLLLVEFVTIIFLNFIGAFGRKITSEEFMEGLRVTTYSFLLVIIPLCLICGAITKPGKPKLQPTEKIPLL